MSEIPVAKLFIEIVSSKRFFLLFLNILDFIPDPNSVILLIEFNEISLLLLILF